FFVIYAAWGMISEDSRDYAAAALDQADVWGGQSIRALDVVIDVWSIGLVVVAFVARWLLQRFAERLPGWTSVVAAYLEAVWVLVALLIVRELLAGVPGWFATRRMFAPIVDVVATWRDEQPWFRWVGDALSWLVTELGDVVFQPLAWVALAAIVYAGIATAPAPPRAADDGHRGLPGALAADRRVAADHLVGGSPRPRRLPGELRHRACRGRMA